MNKRISWLFGVILSIAVGQLAFVDVNADAATNMCNCGKHIEKMIHSLHLTPEQKMQIKKIRAESKAKTLVNKQKMHAIRKEIHAWIIADNMDEAKLNELINQSKDVIGDIMRIKITTRHQIYHLLNAKQKTEVDKMWKKWDDKKNH